MATKHTDEFCAVKPAQTNTNRPCRWRGTPNDEKLGYFQAKSESHNPDSQKAKP